MDISIVIPTRNEERVLPRLLRTLEAQTCPPREIIVADAESTDGTAAIARSHGCTVVPGGLPARGRNNGARASRGQMILFLDSDTLVDPTFLEGFSRQVRSRRLEAGTVYNIPLYQPGDQGYGSLAIRLLDRLIYFLHNVGLVFSTLIRYPYATGTCMFCRRELFLRLGGFDESLTAFEDSEFAARAVKVCRYGVIKKPPVYISTRRFDQHNRIRFALYLTLRGFVARGILGEKRRGDYFNNQLR